MRMVNIPKLKEILNYNPDSGLFTWMVDFKNHVKKGRIAGSISKHANKNYTYIHYNKYSHPAHILAWIYMTGKTPNNCIDHINEIGTDNRWCNLRCVSQSENAKNRLGASITSSSGITGVREIKETKNWVAKIHPNKKNIHIGTFKTKKSAIEARWLAEIKHNYPNCFTISSSYVFLKQNSLKLDVIFRG